jgi:Skp family chaperone for outer membrane proteins
MAKTSSHLLPAVAVLALGALPALAQDPPAAGAPRTSPRIAVIDMNRVSAESLMGKGYATKIEALENEIKSEGTKKQAELQKIDAAIKALQDELDKQASLLSAEAADRKRQDIVKKSRERQAFLEDGQQDLARMRERAQAQAENLNNEFQVKIKPHIDAVAKEKGIDIILSNQVALTVNKDFDISRDVIVKADDAERKNPSAKGPAAPAPGAGQPAGAPAAAPPAAAPPAVAPAASAPATPTPAPTPKP